MRKPGGVRLWPLQRLPAVGMMPGRKRSQDGEETEEWNREEGSEMEGDGEKEAGRSFGGGGGGVKGRESRVYLESATRMMH